MGMGGKMREAVIVSSVRTPIGRAFKGTLRSTRPDELAAVAIKGALDRIPQLDPKEIEDVILGCAMPEAEQGMNVARIASLRAGLPVEASASPSIDSVPRGCRRLPMRRSESWRERQRSWLRAELNR